MTLTKDFAIDAIRAARRELAARRRVTALAKGLGDPISFGDAAALLQSMEKSPTTPPAEKPPRPKKDRLGRAFVLLLEHPDWTNRRIAKAAGVHWTTLSRNRLFKLARKAAQGNALLARRERER